MKRIVVGLVLLAMVFGVVYGLSRIDLGERLPCVEDGCEEPQRISGPFCRDCAERHYIEVELEKAKGRRRYMRIWKVADSNLERVRKMADAISPPTPEVVSARKRWDKDERKRRNKILRQKGLLPR